MTLLIGKRLASVSTQDTVYSRQIPIYLESYIIPIYTYRYTGIAIYTGVNDFYQPLRDFLHPLVSSRLLHTPVAHLDSYTQNIIFQTSRNLGSVPCQPCLCGYHRFTREPLEFRCSQIRSTRSRRSNLRPRFLHQLRWTTVITRQIWRWKRKILQRRTKRRARDVKKIFKDKADHSSIKQEKAVEEAASGGHRAWNFTKFI